MWLDRRAHITPNNYIGVAAGNYVQLSRSTIRKVRDFFMRAGIKHSYNKNEKLIQLEDGCDSQIVFITLDTDDTYLQGPEFGDLGVDEAELLSFGHYRKLKSRVRKANAFHQKRFFLNPPPEAHFITEAYKAGRHKFFIASTLENKTLPDDYIQDMSETYPVGSLGYRRYIMGEIGVPVEGAVYPEYHSKIHMIEPENVPPFIGYASAIDFGYRNPTAFLLGGLSEDDELYICGEHYASGWLLADHAAAILSMHQGTVPFADHDPQDAAELAKYGVGTQPADKTVAAGIDAVRRRLATKRLFFVRGKCPNTIREIGQYKWADGSKEIPAKINDHAMDALRYMVMGLDGAELDPEVRKSKYEWTEID